LFALGIGVRFRLIEFGVTRVITGGFAGFEGKFALITKIEGEIVLSPKILTAETLKL
jgi:hypothetical protein